MPLTLLALAGHTQHCRGEEGRDGVEGKSKVNNVKAKEGNIYMTDPG